MNMSFPSHPIAVIRKSRPCGWCNELVETGNPAIKYSGVTEGDFYSGIMHPECDVPYAAMSRKEWDQIDGKWETGEFSRGTKVFKE